jgi:uncharacterized integral membrane protein
MRFFGWLAFLVVLLIAGFAIQNSTLPVLSVKLLLWRVETAPVYVVIVSLIAGVLITVLLWSASAIRESVLKRALKREIKTLKQRVEDMEAEKISKDVVEREDRQEEGDLVADVTSRKPD